MCLCLCLCLCVCLCLCLCLRVYVWCGQLTNWMGVSSAVGSLHVYKTFDPTLPVYLSGPRFQTTFRYQAFSLQASTISSFAASCFDPSSITKFTVSMAWSQLTALPADTTTVGGVAIANSSICTTPITTVASLKQPMALLAIPAYTLLSNQTYVFQLLLTASITIAGIATATQIAVLNYLAVSVLASPLVARITGSDRNVFVGPASPLFVLDGSSSMDPDVGVGFVGLSFAWTCQRTVSATSCFNASFTTQLAVPSASPRLLLDANLMSPSFNDPFAFQLLVTKGGRRAVSNVVQVTAISVALPLIAVAVFVPTQGPTYIKINPQDSVQLQATLTPIGTRSARPRPRCTRRCLRNDRVCGFLLSVVNSRHE